VGRSKEKQRKLNNTLNNFIAMPKRLHLPLVYRVFYKDVKYLETSWSGKYLEDMLVDMEVEEQ
jgi:hypothetical protein